MQTSTKPESETSTLVYQ